MNSKISLIAGGSFHVMLLEAFFAEIDQFLQCFAVVDRETVLEDFFDLFFCFQIEYLLVLLRLINNILEAVHLCFDLFYFSRLPTLIQQLFHRLVIGYHQLDVLIICRVFLLLFL